MSPVQIPKGRLNSHSSALEDQKLQNVQRKLQDVQPLMNYQSVKSWILNHKESARKNALYRFAAFVRWRAKKGYSTNPDEWIEECLNGNNMTLITHLRVLKEWVESDEIAGCENVTRLKYYRNARSFYAYNLVTLPQSKLNVRGKKESEIPQTITAASFLQMISKVLNSKISLLWKSVIIIQTQSGMDDSTLAKVFNVVGFPQLAKHFGTEDWTRWDENNGPVRIDLMRPKSDYYHYTFLDHDSIMLLKDWLNYRSSKYGKIRIQQSSNPKIMPKSDPIFIHSQKRALTPEYVSVMWNRAGKTAGVNVVPEEKLPRYKGSTRRYPFHAHEVRDTLVTLGRPCGVDRAVVNFFVGHDIDELKYDKSPWNNPEHFKQEYSKISKHLNVISGKEALLKEDYERKLEHEVKKRDEEVGRLQDRVDRVEEILATVSSLGLVQKGIELQLGPRGEDEIKEGGRLDRLHELRGYPPKTPFQRSGSSKTED